MCAKADAYWYPVTYFDIPGIELFMVWDRNTFVWCKCNMNGSTIFVIENI